MSRGIFDLRLLGLILLVALTGAASVCTAQAERVPSLNPDDCADIWQDIGLPQAASGSSEHTTIVCHLGYITGHNDSRKGPNWVVERLTPDLTKKGATRENDNFSADTLLPEKARAQPTDYDGNGFNFDKGHNAPAADFSGDKAMLDDTFFYSNAVPQIGAGFNRTIWRSLETQVRNLIGSNHKVMYVITGSVWQDSKPIKIGNDVCGSDLVLPTVQPVSICPENHHKKNAECSAGVAVPAAMFKIVYDPVMQNAFAVLMENENHTGRYKQAAPYIKAHNVGVATVEKLTGLRFFTALPARKQKQIRSNCVDVKQH
jgi:endonuclease G, mitochondrial